MLAGCSRRVTGGVVVTQLRTAAAKAAPLPFTPVKDRSVAERSFSSPGTQNNGMQSGRSGAFKKSAFTRSKPMDIIRGRVVKKEIRGLGMSKAGNPRVVASLVFQSEDNEALRMVLKCPDATMDKVTEGAFVKLEMFKNVAYGAKPWEPTPDEKKRFSEEVEAVLPAESWLQTNTTNLEGVVLTSQVYESNLAKHPEPELVTRVKSNEVTQGFIHWYDVRPTGGPSDDKVTLFYHSESVSTPILRPGYPVEVAYIPYPDGTNYLEGFRLRRLNEECTILSTWTSNLRGKEWLWAKICLTSSGAEFTVAVEDGSDDLSNARNRKAQVALAPKNKYFRAVVTLGKKRR